MSLKAFLPLRCVPTGLPVLINPRGIDEDFWLFLVQLAILTGNRRSSPPSRDRRHAGRQGVTMNGQAVELAISELRRGLEVGMANVEGQLALLQHLHDHQARRVDEHARLLNELNERLSAAERDQVTRAQLDARFRHTIALLSLLVTAASVVVTAAMALVD